MATLIAAIPSPPTNVLHLGPFTVHIYGLCYAAAVIAAVAITRRRWVAQGGSPELVYDVALWGFPAGIVGGRLYYLATTPGSSLDHWWGPLAVWQGGLGIWGGIALGTIVGVWRIRRAGADVAAFLDAAAPALLVAQAIGRVGNYFNQELFGRPTDLPWAVEIDPNHRPARYIARPDLSPDLPLRGHVESDPGGRHRLARTPPHPIRPPGLFALYVAGYCAFRIVDELLRVDPAAHVFGVRWNLLLAAGGTLAGLAWYAASQREPSPPVARAPRA